MDKKRGRAFVLCISGLLCALAISLSALEGLLPPLPIPGAKWGLSNLAVMFALAALPLPAAAGVTAAKTAFALLRGVTAFFMSAGGGLCSFLIMAACLRLGRGRVSFIGTGVLGAAAHGMGQVLVGLCLFGPGLLAFAPLLLLAASVTGAATGLLVNLLWPALQRWRPR